MRENQTVTQSKYRVFSLVVAIVLPLVVYLLSVPRPIYRFMIPAFLALVFLTQVYAWSTQLEFAGQRRWAIVRSACFFVSWFCIFFVVPADFRVLYMLISVPVLFLGQVFVLYTGETVLVAHTMLCAIGALLGAAAAEFYFKAGSTLLTLMVFSFELVLCLATYAFIPQSSKVRLLSSLVVALLATELYTATLFLPFHYTVLGFLTFLGFYVLWLLTYYWQFGVLTKRRVQFYLVTALALAVLVLLATPWRIVP